MIDPRGASALLAPAQPLALARPAPTSLRAQAAELLREARKDEGLSQLELADFLGVNARTLQRWEAQDSTVSLCELEVVARALGLRLRLMATPAE